MIFRFAYPIILIILISLIVIFAAVRWVMSIGIRYRYSLAKTLRVAGYATKHPYRYILFVFRLSALILLALVVARPQRGDVHSQTNMHGIDIMLALDISGSMRLVDDERDGRTRIDIAKQEAIRFIKKRNDDAIGLVLFAKDAFSRCPITLDKKMITTIVNEVYLGFLDDRETYLATGLVMAANRLKSSKAKSKVIILLTDGAPSQTDLDPQIAIDVAKQLGVKVYTIGIGSELPVTVMTMMGPMQMQTLNKELLQKIAHETGGKFFKAHDAHDMRAIYDTIDQLEKTSYQVQHYAHYDDVFIPFAWAALVALVFEMILSTFVWFAL